MTNTPPDKPNSFADLVLNQPKRFGSFIPMAHYDRDGDCVEFLLSDEDFYAERIDGLVTVYYGRSSGNLIGSLIKDVSRIIKGTLSRAPGFQIEVVDGDLRLEHLFTAHLWTSTDPPTGTARIVYEKLREEAQRVNAHFDASGLVGAK